MRVDHEHQCRWLCVLASACRAADGRYQHLFDTLDDARRKLALWRYDYNNVRPHSSLGNQTPAEAPSHGLPCKRLPAMVRALAPFEGSAHGPKPDPINPRRKHLCNSCRWQTSSNLQGKCLWSELRKNVVKILTKAFRVILATARTRSAARRMSATGVSRKAASQIFLATLYEWQCNLGNNHRGAQVFGRTQPRPV